jgi:hypothetical protein
VTGDTTYDFVIACVKLMDCHVSVWWNYNALQLLARGCAGIPGSDNPVSTTLRHKIFHNLVMALIR